MKNYVKLAATTALCASLIQAAESIMYCGTAVSGIETVYSAAPTRQVPDNRALGTLTRAVLFLDQSIKSPVIPQPSTAKSSDVHPEAFRANDGATLCQERDSVFGAFQTMSQARGNTDPVTYGDSPNAADAMSPQQSANVALAAISGCAPTKASVAPNPSSRLGRSSGAASSPLSGTPRAAQVALLN